MAEYPGYLTKLQKLTLPSTWNDVGQIRDLPGPNSTADTIDVSHRGSRRRRFVPGLIDSDEMTFDVIFDPDLTSHDPTVSGSLVDDLETGAVSSYRVVFPGDGDDTTTATFDAFVTGFEPSSPLEDGITADVTLKPSGGIAWAHVPG